MRRIAVFALFTLFAAWSPASAQAPDIRPYTGTGLFSGFKRKYLPQYMPPVNTGNSNRLDSLMRAGRIYLSLQDAIALALENNLDIEYARYGPRLAETDELRASAGQLLRGISSNIRQGPSSATSGVLAGANSLGSAGGTTTGGTEGGILSGMSVQLAGAAIPNLDPTLYANAQYYHQTQPQTSSFITGTNFLVSQFKTANWGFQKGFLTGTTVTLDMNNTILGQNAPTNDFNPTTRSNFGVQINQRLLQGFGFAVNNRAIRVAKNNRHVSDLVFREQVIATISNVVSLYYDLVSLNDILKVRQQALELATKLYTDNRRRAEIGTIAPIEIVQAEAEMEASQQQVTDAETQVMQQEMIIKNVLTRSGVDNLALVDARVVPTDRIEVPATEQIEPVQDLVVEALENRPEIEQSRIQLENSRISIQGTKSALLPSLDVFANLQNNALAGQVNTVTYQGIEDNALLQLLAKRSAVNPFFIGSYGTVLGQLFARNFPDYAVGFQLNIPLRNSAAQADLIKDQLNLRQQQINDRQLQNNIKLNVLNARIAVGQARAAYETSVKARILQEQTLNGERRKYQLGTSSFLNVVIVQRDLVTRQSAEVSAVSTYIRARNNLDTITGRILGKYDVHIDEAYKGVVNRPPSTLPVLDKP